MTSSNSVEQGYLQIDNVPNYGLGVVIAISRRIQLELLWISEQTHVSLENIPSGLTEDPFDMNVHYFQVGGVWEMR